MAKVEPLEACIPFDSEDDLMDGSSASVVSSPLPGTPSERRSLDCSPRPPSSSPPPLPPGPHPGEQRALTPEDLAHDNLMSRFAIPGPISAPEPEARPDSSSCVRDKSPSPSSTQSFSGDWSLDLRPIVVHDQPAYTNTQSYPTIASGRVVPPVPSIFCPACPPHPLAPTTGLFEVNAYGNPRRPLRFYTNDMKVVNPRED